MNTIVYEITNRMNVAQVLHDFRIVVTGDTPASPVPARLIDTLGNTHDISFLAPAYDQFGWKFLATLPVPPIAPYPEIITVEPNEKIQIVIDSDSFNLDFIVDSTLRPQVGLKRVNIFPAGSPYFRPPYSDLVTTFSPSESPWQVDIIGFYEGATPQSTQNVAVLSTPLAVISGNRELLPPLLPGFTKALDGQILIKRHANPAWESVTFNNTPTREIVSMFVQFGNHIMVSYSDGNTYEVGEITLPSSIAWPDGGSQGNVLSKVGPQINDVAWVDVSDLYGQPTQEQVDAAVLALNPVPTQQQVDAAVEKFNPQISQSQIDNAIAALNPQPTQGQVNAAVSALALQLHSVTLDGLKYALPDAQVFNYPTVDGADRFIGTLPQAGEQNQRYYSLTPFTFAPSTFDAITPHGATQVYRFGTSVPESSDSQQAPSGLVGKKIKQGFNLPQVTTTSKIYVKFSQPSGNASGFVADSIYTVRLYDDVGTLIKTWQNINLRYFIASIEGGGKVQLDLDTATVVQSGLIEVEVVSLSPTSKPSGSTTYKDINFYPVAETIPAGLSRPSATNESGIGVISVGGAPLVLSAPIFESTTFAVTNAQIFSDEGGMQFKSNGQRLISALPSLPRPAASVSRKAVIVFQPKIIEGMYNSEFEFQVLVDSLENLQSGQRVGFQRPLTFFRSGGQAAYTLNQSDTLPIGVRLRIEVTVVRDTNGSIISAKLYNDASGALIKSTSNSSSVTPSQLKQIRFAFSPSIYNTNVCFCDDLVISRWVEWSE